MGINKMIKKVDFISHIFLPYFTKNIGKIAY